MSYQRCVQSVALSFALIFTSAAYGQGELMRRGDLSVLVAVGDSLAAGSQNIGLEETSQPHGFAALIARQARVDFPLPLVKYPGAPTIIGLMPDGSIGPIAIPGLVERANPTIAPANLAVPSFTLKQALEYRPNRSVPRTLPDRGPLVLGVPGVFSDPTLADCIASPRPACVGNTMVELAKAKKPTTTIVWIGNNDTLPAALFGVFQLLTPVESFRTDFRRLMSELQSTGSKLVVGTIPDVTSIPYFVSAEQIADDYNIPRIWLWLKTGVAPNDYVRRSALPLIDSILRNKTAGPLPEVCAPPIYLFPQVPCRLKAAEAELVQDRTREFNRIIRAEAYARGAVLVDTNKLVNDMAREGYVVANRQLTTRFLGGLFSLDGIHPSNTGHAVIANYFIEEMNEKMGLRIPSVSVAAVWAQDPLKNHVPVVRPRD